MRPQTTFWALPMVPAETLAAAMGIGYCLGASWFLIYVLVIGAVHVGIVSFSHWTTPSPHRVATALSVLGLVAGGVFSFFLTFD
jgi:hypothetical protein